LLPPFAARACPGVLLALASASAPRLCRGTIHRARRTCLATCTQSAPLQRARLCRVPSFRAECPAPLVLRKSPGHAVEESLLDVTPGNIANRREIPRLRHAPANTAGKATPRVTPLGMTLLGYLPATRRAFLVPPPSWRRICLSLAVKEKTPARCRRYKNASSPPSVKDTRTTTLASSFQPLASSQPLLSKGNHHNATNAKRTIRRTPARKGA
jgi:hypothetical protein